MSGPIKKMKIIIISDGTGETGTAVVRATMTQFKDKDVYLTRYKNVLSKERLDAIFTEAAIHHDLIAYTIVDSELREYISELSRKTSVRSLDILGPALTQFSNYFDQEPSNEPGLFHKVDDEYFRRVQAMEFTLNHDDGKNVESLHLCDVILLGVSRTSKTPLSVYLSQHGIKVVNIPIIEGTSLPAELFKVDQRKIFGLTIDPEELHNIRQKRLKRLGTTHTEEYAGFETITTELQWANNIFRENKRWPVFNITGKAIEETAAEIMKLMNMRKNNRFKQSK